MTVGCPDITALLGQDWQQRRPRYRALADQLASTIASGELPSGSRLPAERELSTMLGVSRSTVVSAYDILRRGGRLASQTGSGTFVTSPTPAAQRLHLRDMVDAQVHAPGSRHAATQAINLSISRPEPLHDALRDAISASAEAIGPLAESVEYAPQGLPELRALIAEAFTRRGLPTAPRQILVTSGAQQAIGLIAQLYVTAGDSVVLESPTYLGAIDAMRARGAQLVALPGVAADLDPADIEALIRRVMPSLLFLMPTCHTITGAITPGPTRQRLAELSHELQMPVIEDDIFTGLTFEDVAAPPMAAHAEDAPIFTIGSTSKLLWNGLRVGWLRAPDAVITRLARIKGAVDLGTSLIPQLVTMHLLSHADKITHRRREEIRDRLELTTRLLAATLPDWSWETPRGGRSLWIRLPHGPAGDFVQLAQRHGVLVVSGATLSPDGANDDRLRLMFVHRPEVLAEGIQRLALAWAEYSPAHSPSSP